MPSLYPLQTEKAYSQVKNGTILVCDSLATFPTKLQLMEILRKNNFTPKKITRVNLPAKNYTRGKKSNKVSRNRYRKYCVQLTPASTTFTEETVINF